MNESRFSFCSSRYTTIVADPPWRYQKDTSMGAKPGGPRCGTKGCPNEPTERVPDRKLPNVVYDLCSDCAAGMRLFQRMQDEGAIRVQ